MQSTTHKIPPHPASRSRPKPQRTETLRPFIQKYQYQQLPLPEPHPPVDEGVSGEQPNLQSGKELCAAFCEHS